MLKKQGIILLLLYDQVLLLLLELLLHKVDKVVVSTSQLIGASTSTFVVNSPVLSGLATTGSLGS